MSVTFSCSGGGRKLFPARDAVQVLAEFRGGLYRCLTRRGDALFALADAVLCEDRRVTDLAHLSLVPEFGRGHGALYDGLNAGRVQVARLRRAVAGLRLPRGRTAGSGWRSMSVTGCGRTRRPARSGCSAMCTGGGRTPGRWSRGGRTRSWRRWGRAVELGAAAGRGAAGPGDDDCAVTAAQLRDVTRLIAAGHWKPATRRSSSSWTRVQPGPAGGAAADCRSPGGPGPLGPGVLCSRRAPAAGAAGPHRPLRRARQVRRPRRPSTTRTWTRRGPPGTARWP